jgi:hypothetical protein
VTEDPHHGLGWFLSTAVTLLTAHQIPFMIAGSLVSSMYGDPRTTRDVDIVIAAAEPPDDHIVRFVADCEAVGWYVATGSAFGPVDRRRQFNVIDSTSGWKLDVMWRSNRPYSEVEFERRVSAQLFGVAVFVPSPEDVVLSKLEWGGSTGSRQFTDATSVLRINSLDREYLSHWAAVLGVTELLEAAFSAARNDEWG